VEVFSNAAAPNLCCYRQTRLIRCLDTSAPPMAQLSQHFWRHAVMKLDLKKLLQQNFVLQICRKVRKEHLSAVPERSTEACKRHLLLLHSVSTRETKNEAKHGSVRGAHPTLALAGQSLSAAWNARSVVHAKYTTALEMYLFANLVFVSLDKGQ
jgi:hypothetical protein